MAYVQQRNTVARLRGLNQFLEHIYQKPQRLSDILAEHKYAQQDILLLRDLHLKPFLNEFTNGLQLMLRELRDGERLTDIITRRYGLEDGRQQTLQEIAENHDVSRERIRQLQVKTVRRMKNRRRKMQLEQLVVTVAKGILGEPRV